MVLNDDHRWAAYGEQQKQRRAAEKAIKEHRERQAQQKAGKHRK